MGAAVANPSLEDLMQRRAARKGTTESLPAATPALEDLMARRQERLGEPATAAARPLAGQPEGRDRGWGSAIFKSGMAGIGGIAGGALGTAAGPLGTGIGGIGGAGLGDAAGEFIVQTFEDEPYDWQAIGQSGVIGGAAQAVAGPAGKALGAAAGAARPATLKAAKYGLKMGTRALPKALADGAALYLGGVQGALGSYLLRQAGRPVLRSVIRALENQPAKQKAFRELTARTSQRMEDVILEGGERVLDPRVWRYRAGRPAGVIEVTDDIVEQLPDETLQKLGILRNAWLTQIAAIGGPEFERALRNENRTQRATRLGRYRGIRQ